LSTPRRFVPVAVVARPHGVLGELRLKLYNEGSSLLLDKPPIRLRLASGEERDVRLVSVREADKALLVRLPDIPDRNAAELLRGAELCVPRDAFPALEPGEFYACDIEGARVVMPDGSEAGSVEELRSYPTCDVLVVRTGKGTLEVPLVEPYVLEVDAAIGVVRAGTLEGLE